MGKRNPSAPAPPDPAATARAQAATNKETAITEAELNFVNQVTPGGTLGFEQTSTSAAGNPQYTATTSLSPEQQAVFDLQTQASTRYGEIGNEQLNTVGERLSAPLDFDQFGAAPAANEATRQAATQSIIDRAQPQQDIDRQRLETRLANQGIDYGSEAYDNAFRPFDNSINDFRLGADAYGGAEQSRLFGLESAARDRAVNETIQGRTQPLNELSALFSGTQVQGPQFVNTPQTNVAPTDLIGATYASYNGEQNAYNQALSKQNAFTGGLFGLGSAGIGAYGSYLGSDRRLKENIKRIGAMANGLAVYTFNYIGAAGERVGVMADEVRKAIPAAVRRIGGFDAVDYDMVLEGTA